MRLHELVLANEQAITGMSEEEVNKGLDRITEVMEHAVELGIQTTGVLPGPIGLQRKAPAMYEWAKENNFRDRASSRRLTPTPLPHPKKMHPATVSSPPLPAARQASFPPFFSCSNATWEHCRKKFAKDCSQRLPSDFWPNTMPPFPARKSAVRAKSAWPRPWLRHFCHTPADTVFSN